MGGGNVKSKILNKTELTDFHNMSYLSNDLILTFFKRFSILSAIKEDDGIIDYEEFCMMIGGDDNILTKKLFNVIDFNHDNRINFREFLGFISCFISGSLEDQKKVSFKLFADEETNLINRSFIDKMLKKTLQVDFSLIAYFDDSTLDEIINESFKNIENEFLTHDEFCVIMDKNPSILNWFKVDINKIKEKISTRSSICFG